MPVVHDRRGLLEVPAPPGRALRWISAREVPAKKPITLKVGKETVGRPGNGMTTVFDLPLDEDSVWELAVLFKQRGRTAGTVKNGRIEIQGRPARAH